jgi:putative MATE family efflux protein
MAERSDSSSPRPGTVAAVAEAPGARPSPSASAPVDAASLSLWSIIVLALKGGHVDFTSAPINRAIVLLAVPMVMEMLMESVFAVVDVFWVAHLGANAVAAVGLTESLLMIIYTLAIGVSIGATALVARRTGEGNPEAAARSAAQSILLGVIVSLLIAAVGFTFWDRLLTIMGASPEVIATGGGFTRIMLTTNIVIVLLFVINAVFRGAGDAAVAMRVLWLANILNIVLGPCFIFGLGPLPEMGVTGAAVATSIGRGTGVLFQLFMLFSGRGRVTVRARHFLPDLRVIGSVLRLSGSATLQVLISTTSYIGLIRIISTFGSIAVAGYTIGIRLVLLALLPSFGLANAAATLVGQNLGARHPERAEQAVWQACRYNLVFLGSVGIIFFLFAAPIVSVFTPDAAVRMYAGNALRIISAGFFFYAYGMVVSQSFNGAGDTWTPTLINLGVFWCFEVPLAWYLSHHTALGANGVFAALTIAFCTFAVVAVLVFRRGKWKLTRV